MPLIQISKKVLFKKLGKQLSEEKLKDRIAMLGTDLESIDGDLINVEVFPNRPDMLSEQGFCRAFASFIGVKTGLHNYKIEDSKEKVIIDKSVASVRPYTACAIVTNLKFNDEEIREIIQVQEKLHISFGRNRKRVAIGIYPFEKIKTPIYYKAISPDKIKFQPLESNKEMTAKQILSQHPAGKEYAHLLEGYDKYPLFIDSNNNILSMPPIINSHLIGKINEKTNEVFVECSGFDFRVLQQCLNIIVTTLADMGGEINSMQLNYPTKTYITPDLRPLKMELDINYVNKLLGTTFSEKEIKKYLGRMGFDYQNKIVLVPSYRTDILHQIDLTEDIAIAYGYENFKGKLPDFFTLGEEHPFEIFKRKISHILIGLGLIELYTYNLSSHEIQQKKMNSNIELIELENPTSKEHTVLRSWMIPSLLQVLSENKHNEYPQNIFDIGTIFKKGKTETGVEEADRLGIALCHEKVDFTQIKQRLDYLMKLLNLNYSIDEVNHPSFINGRVGRVIVNNKKIAYIGEINPSVLENFELEFPVATLELNLTELFSLI